jgi:hypothetical protein
MKKDDIKKIIYKVYSAFDRFSIILLFGLILLVTYVGILRLISSFYETTKAVVVIGIPLAVLIFMLIGFSKGGKIRQGFILSLIGFFGGMIFMRAINYLTKLF